MRPHPRAVKRAVALSAVAPSHNVDGVRRYLATLALFVGAVLPACAPASDSTARVVGSSTVYPFAVLASERIEGRVVVEATGSGAGHRIFCAPDSEVDIVLSSRRRLPGEAQACERNGRGGALDVPLGTGAIVLARAGGQTPQSLSRTELWRALAARLPDSECQFVSNPHMLWSDIRMDLPQRPIVVQGPPPTSGTRDAFAALALEPGARADACMQQLESRDPAAFRAAATALRADGAWVDAGENDAGLARRLKVQPDTLGVVSLAAVSGDAGLDMLRIDGVAPTPANVSRRRYPLVRSLHLYLAPDAPNAARALVREMLSPAALQAAGGESGYLVAAGLVAPSGPDRLQALGALDGADTSPDATP